MSTPVLPEYVAPYKPVPQITPFTYRDGVTMLKKLELLQKYINKTLVPFVNDNTEELGDQFEEQVNILIDAVNAAIESVINDSIEVQDPVVAALVNSSSATQTALDARYVNETDFTTTINGINGQIAAINSAISALNLRVDKIEGYIENVVRPEDFGAVGDGVTNDAPAFNDALAAISAGGILKLSPSTTYKLNSGITIEARLHRIEGGPNTVINATGMVGGIVITVEGDEPYPPHKSNDNVLTGFDLIGPGKTSLVTAILFAAPGPDTDHAVHNIAITNLNVKDFGVGLSYFTNAYNITAFNIAVYTCGIGVQQPNGGTNYGERISYIASTFTACDVAVKHEFGNGNFNFINCSFDYNEVSVLEQSNGRVVFNTCHFEYRDTTTAPAFVVSGDNYTMLHITGGNLHVAGSTPDAGRGFDSIVDNTSDGLVLIDSVFIANAGTPSGYFSTGDGMTKGHNIYVPLTTPSMPAALADSSSLLPSAHMKDNVNVVDPWFITEDTAAITSRLDGTNVDIQSTTVRARTGTRSVRVVKNGAGIGRAALIVPIQEAQAISWRLFYSAVGAVSGTAYLETVWANCVNLKNDPDFVELGVAGSTIAINKVANVDIGWTEYNNLTALREVPGGATHIIFKINMDNIGATEFYFDDCVVSSW